MGQRVVHVVGTHQVQGRVPDGVLLGEQVGQELEEEEEEDEEQEERHDVRRQQLQQTSDTVVFFTVTIKQLLRL